MAACRPALTAPTWARSSVGLDAICRRPAVTEPFASLGKFYATVTTAAFNAFVAREIEQWRPMIVAADAVGRG